MASDTNPAAKAGFPLSLTATRVTVLLLDHSTDLVTIRTTLAPTLPAFPDEPAVFKTECAINTGIEWVRKNLGVEPEVIDARSKTK